MELCNSPLSHTSPSTAFVFCLTEPSFLGTARHRVMGSSAPNTRAKKKSLFITRLWEEICVRCTYVVGVHGNMQFTCVCSHRGRHVSSVQACVLYSCVISAYVCTCVCLGICFCVCVRLCCSYTCLGMFAGWACAFVWVCVCL